MTKWPTILVFENLRHFLRTQGVASRTAGQKLGLFVLNWIHFVCWLQIWWYKIELWFFLGGGEPLKKKLKNMSALYKHKERVKQNSINSFFTFVYWKQHHWMQLKNCQNSLEDFNGYSKNHWTNIHLYIYSCFNNELQYL